MHLSGLPPISILNPNFCIISMNIDRGIFDIRGSIWSPSHLDMICQSLHFFLNKDPGILDIRVPVWRLSHLDIDCRILHFSDD